MASSFAVPEISDMPAISVIIPIYSAGKYIGECLDSLLNQTFPDFEVIVVDDGSTDKSAEIVKKYIDRFNRRLRLVRTEKNTELPGEPRNEGISLASGEYIYCLDGGDALTATALEEMYALGKKFDADVVYCERYYTSTGTGQEFKDNVRIDDKTQKPPFVDKPTLETDNLAERVKKFLAENYSASPSLRLVRRDLLTYNNITFPPLIDSEDVVWSMEILFCAKRFLRIPNICFIKRAQDKEISLTQYTAPNQVRKLMDLTVRSLKDLDNFMQEIKFFRENPRQRYDIINRAVSAGFADFFKKFAAQSPFDVYDIFQKKFGEYLGEQDVLVSSLFAYVFNQHKTSEETQSSAVIPAHSAEKYKISAESQISVIIPLHNAEEYIGECLDSLLAQTFQNFEVIVVDDGSTDNSVKIVEEYAPKFEGRLSLAQAEENPRNKGIELADGEYLYFIDPNDTIAPTALETLYTAAKNFKADVVHCEKYYLVPDKFYHDAAYRETLKPCGWSEKTFITQPTLLTSDLEKRVRDFSQKWLQCDSYLQLIRRDFLRDNDIHFSDVYSQDTVFTICELCTAKNYLVVPDVLYYRRQLNDSENVDAAQTLHEYATALKDGVKFLDDFLNGREFFAKRTDLKYALFDTLFTEVLSKLDNTYRQIPAYELCELLRKEFDNDSDSMFTAFVFNALNVYRLQLDPPREPITEPTLEIPPQNDEAQPVLLDKEPYIFSKNLPKISVVIPMYNVEKYVGECLDSLLAQTVQNFEVIVADDCSTDSSRAVVESYMEKFDGRLTLVQLEKNTGYAGFPRNKGIELARGEYIYFLDPDDTISPTALEELYTAAKNFNADVVHCEKFYRVPAELYHDAEYKKNAPPHHWGTMNKIYTTQPSFLPKDFETRIVEWSKGWLTWSPVIQFIRRDFLIENGIRFLNIYSEDLIFTMCELCCAKNYLVMPNIFYYWRMRKDSSSQEKLDVPQIIKRYLAIFKEGSEYLDEFLSRQEFFAKRPDLKYILLDMLFVRRFPRLDNIYRNMPAHELDGLLRKEIGGENSAFTAFLFSAMNIYRLKLNPSPKHIVVPEIELERVGSRDADFSLRKIPAISVIIPMYNAEEYVGECLDSVLNQTFQDFEVIVVDDCSEDNSVAIVERFAPKFNGRLRLAHTKKNSGGGGYVPRNLGLKLSHGEYIYFIDADDFILDNALETLHKAAKEYDADVVYTSAYYDYDAEGKFLLKSTKEQLSLIIDDPDKNLKQLIFGKDTHMPYTKFVLRDFLIENEIVFPKILTGGDFIWTIQVMYYAKRLLRLPYGFYFYRKQKNSVTQKKREFNDQISVCAKAFLLGAKALYDLSAKIDLLEQDSNYFRSALNPFFYNFLNRTSEARMQLNTQEIYETLSREFAKESSDLPVPFFFSFIDAQKKEIEKLQAVYKRADLTKMITARMDIRFMPKTAGDFQIVSKSDDAAKVSKPAWLNRNGDVGYTLTSTAGNMDFTVKASTDGQIRIYLLSTDVRDPVDKNKRIPYWIDFAKLAINERNIFDKVTPVWHDKPYVYNFAVKADEDIKIETTWLPHRDERLNLSGTSTAVAPIQKTVESDDAAILAKFKRYLSIRLDLQMLTKNKKDFQIVSISDARADVRKPAWFQKEGIGYVIQSYAGKLDIVFKIIDGGLINMDLKGLFYADPKDESRHIPYWIDYTKFTVNETVIFKKRTPIWHDKPYNYTVEAKAGEDITVSFEWLPHRSDI